jgi:hypothetical protein
MPSFIRTPHTHAPIPLSAQRRRAAVLLRQAKDRMNSSLGTADTAPSRRARIPVPAPPPTHALTAPLLVLSLGHRHALQLIRLRERRHTAPCVY